MLAFNEPCLGGYSHTAEDYLVFELRFLWQVRGCVALFCKCQGKPSSALFADMNTRVSFVFQVRNVQPVQRDPKPPGKFIPERKTGSVLRLD